jgi:serine/threonine protein kinase
MTPERWAQVKKLYYQIAELEPAERQNILDSLRPTDPDLRNEVEELLLQPSNDWKPTANIFENIGHLGVPAIVGDDSPDIAKESGKALLASGQTFGPYTVVRLLGSGGMGQVYEVEENESGRRVALKILPPALASSLDRRRFLREGRLAASVSHPNSVYLFGTEEVEGIPTIAMELVHGIPLNRYVEERGPMTSRAAVDTILQVISGLQAAEAAGLLHRDVKPSNCLIDATGTVKISDFGVSISSQSLETQLTTTGTFIGTPAYASPEQLKGEETDVRSDIYSVGATLYYLLTGKPPFEETQPMQLLAAVLQRVPDSPRRLQKQVPQRLANIVLRCLQKDPTARFKSYTELNDALFQFSSNILTPATLDQRLLAGIIDSILLSVSLSVFFQVRTVTTVTSNASAPQFGIANLVANFAFGALLYQFLYFSTLEGVWGTSVGKAICHLRVVGPDGNAPGFLAPLRFGIFRCVALIAIFLSWFNNPLAFFFASAVTGAIARLAFFITARRKNGYAAIHDLLSRTRVVVVGRISKPQGTSEIQNILMGSTEAVDWIGPYKILTAVKTPELADAVFVGEDPKLHRKVWVHRTTDGRPPVSVNRRDLQRGTRLRWLSGRRRGDDNWDAFGYIGGVPLSDLLKQPNSWSAIRRWLFDIAEEWSVGTIDGTVDHSLQLEQLWVTFDGHLIVLDFPIGDQSHLLVTETSNDLISVQSVLLRLVITGLTGDGRFLLGAPPDVPGKPLPLKAAAFIRQLRDQTFTHLSDILVRLRELCQEAAVVSRSRRCAHLAFIGLIPLEFAVVAAVTTYANLTFAREYPQYYLFEEHLMQRESLEKDRSSTDAVERQRRALDVYLTSSFQTLWLDREHWPRFFTVVIATHPQRIRLVNDALRNYPTMRAADIAAATSELEDLRDKASRALERGRTLFGNLQPAFSGIGRLLFSFALVSVLSAAVFRGGISYRLFEIAVVENGVGVSRTRALSRALTAWLPSFLCAATLAYDSTHLPLTGVILIVCAAVLQLVGAAWAVYYPSRGLQDQIAGTYLVPR